MKQLSLTQKKWLKSVHVLAAGIWITTGLVMFLLHFLRSRVETGDQLYMMNLIIHFIDMKILVPSALLSLITGWLYSQFTKWGYIKHGWISYKWVITLLIIILGTIYSGPWITEMANISKEIGLKALDNPEYLKLDRDQSIMGVCMTGTLIITIFISVFKPKKATKSIKQ